MAHKRSAIISALAARLTGLPTSGARVFPERIRPLVDADLPAILIHEGGEDEPPGHMSTGAPVSRTLRVTVTLVVKSTANAAQTTNDMLAEVESAIFDTIVHNTLAGLVHSIRLASIDDPEMDDSTDKPVRRLPVIFRVTYSS